MLLMFSWAFLFLFFLFCTCVYILCSRVYACSRVCACGGHGLSMGVFLDLSLVWIWLVYLASLLQGANLCLPSAGVTGGLPCPLNWGSLYGNYRGEKVELDLFILLFMYLFLSKRLQPTVPPEPTSSLSRKIKFGPKNNIALNCI